MESETLYPEEIQVIEKWFKIYDKNGDGLLDKDEFRAVFKDFLGGSNEEAQGLFSSFAENDHISLPAATKVISGFHHDSGIKKIFQSLEKLQSTVKDLPDGEPDKHSIKVSLGNTEHAKTKIDFKVFLDDEKGKQHFEEAVKGLKFTKEQLGFIFKFHTHSPAETKEKLEKLVKMGLAVLKNTVLRPNSPESNFVNTLKFEYGLDDHSVTLAIHSEHKGVQFALEYIQVFWHKFNVEKVRGNAHVQIALHNDLHKLTSDNKDERDVIKALKEGGLLSVDLNSNADKLLKRVLRPRHSYDLEGPLLVILAFLQKGSKVEIGADELDLDVFTPKQGEKAIPVIDLFDQEGNSPVPLGEIKAGFEGVQQMKMPIVENALDLFENHLLANVHVSFNTPHIFASLHFKTSGIKEIWTKIKNL